MKSSHEEVEETCPYVHFDDSFDSVSDSDAHSHSASDFDVDFDSSSASRSNSASRSLKGEEYEQILDSALLWSKLGAARTVSSDSELVEVLRAMDSKDRVHALNALAVRSTLRTGASLGTLCVRESAPAMLHFVFDTVPELGDAADRDGHKAVHVAVLENRLSLLRTLLEYNASKFLTSRDATAQQHTALHYACEQKSTAALDALLLAVHTLPSEARKSVLDAKTKEGNSALHICALNGNLPAALKLLTAGATVDESNARGQTALILSAARHDVQILHELLSRGASARACDIDGETAAHHAASVQSQRLVFNYNLPETEGTLATLAALVSRADDLDLNQKNVNGDTALDLVLASLADVLEVVRANREHLSHLDNELDIFILAPEDLARRTGLGAVEASGLHALVSRYLNEARARDSGHGDGPCSLIDTKTIPRTRKFRSLWQANLSQGTEVRKQERCPLGFVGENPHRSQNPHPTFTPSIASVNNELVQNEIDISRARAIPSSTIVDAGIISTTSLLPSTSQFRVPRWIAFLPLLPLAIALVALYVGFRLT